FASIVVYRKPKSIQLIVTQNRKCSKKHQKQLIVCLYAQCHTIDSYIHVYYVRFRSTCGAIPADGTATLAFFGFYCASTHTANDGQHMANHSFHGECISQGSSPYACFPSSAIVVLDDAQSNQSSSQRKRKIHTLCRWAAVLGIGLS